MVRACVPALWEHSSSGRAQDQTARLIPFQPDVGRGPAQHRPGTGVDRKTEFRGKIGATRKRGLQRRNARLDVAEWLKNNHYDSNASHSYAALAEKLRKSK